MTNRLTFLDNVKPDEILLNEEDEEVEMWVQRNGALLVYRHDNDPRVMVAQYMRQGLKLPLPYLLTERHT